MEAASPPKRMTRARAAAKDAATTTSKPAASKPIVSKPVASKPASTRPPSAAAGRAGATTPTPTPTPAVTTTRATKRKTRSDETEDEDGAQTDSEQKGTMNKPAKTRGRPRKIAASEPRPEPDITMEDASTTTARSTRGKARKTATTTTATTTAPKQEPAKATRLRARKAEENKADITTAEPVKKVTRTRGPAVAKATTGVATSTVSTEPTPGLKSAVSRPASRLGGITKKTVSFQEPEKENMLPAAIIKGKAKTATEPATGMRAKPVRKPAAGGRATRASTRSTPAAETREKSPLSPKKDVQNRALSKDSGSDDELATLEKTPLKPLMKSPVKPRAHARNPEPQPPAQDEDEDEDEDAQEAPEPANSSVFGSPARRPPPSPWKDAMKSPAKKVDVIPSLIFASKADHEHAAESLSSNPILQSPAKRPHFPIALQPLSQGPNDLGRSPMKMSLFQSPAKRPTSPFKLSEPAAQPPEERGKRLFAPKTSPVPEEAPAEEQQLPEDHDDNTEHEVAPDQQPEEGEGELESPAQLDFPGRLSAVLPRHADPALRDDSPPAKAVESQEAEPTSQQSTEAEKEPEVADAESNQSPSEVMNIDGAEAKIEEAANPAPTAPPDSPPKQAVDPAFGLRAKDLEDNYLSDSEDELASSGKTLSRFQDNSTLTLGVPSTPTPSGIRTPRNGMPSSAAKAASRAIRSISKGPRLGFTPLAHQLSEWKASSPQKQAGAAPGSPDSDRFSLVSDNESVQAGSTPSKGFFDEEMRIRAEMENQAAIEAALEADIAAQYDEVDLDMMPITSEDVELAAEANEMSLVEAPQPDDHAHDDAVSDASQEYGDENSVPIDPALLNSHGGARHADPATPVRPTAASGPFHTVSKVPLKPADDSTPRIPKRRSMSASKLPAQRPAGHLRSATVISYSPEGASKMDIDDVDAVEHPPVTPSKGDIWSSMGTPARTPRRDLNTALLRGVVAFVDVHTSDGADASSVFVELLTQMGARCVKSWPWNPTSPTGEASTSKVGITHVVYKDGGKRTLEKVRESGGVVQCVGVSWVLDCERENEWLDEAPYYIDTSLVPRGGRNRRKSMEPKALANLNGTLVTPVKNTGGSARECQTVPNNHASRRDSTVWMRTPCGHDDDDELDEHDWDKELSMLTPVPKTPAPEAVARYAMDVTPDSPMAGDDYKDSPERDQLLMRTCPPKKSVYADLGQGVLQREKDQGILMRLMAARRKSLQFAPKIASPLSKAWN
ncbi:hypothetical protein GGS23DRAFT_357674 [Durotheca rogersii]|uniref:uncharacterized protein n=1 Tax=Durotheca rogersii TaxID=419775 RepID=UPI002221224B|nr:uncharacterized protein GGS23DRAFT_357674 [Durotheca rogersii]KAI5865873.1 hypothetical protein GGS23DRAFT_357674 [Durotheca rogersii]